MQIKKISVIIPVYNAQDLLRYALESLDNQDNKNFEVVLVDDGSSDSSLKVCNDYKEHHSDSVKVIHQENAGQVTARLNGVKAASCEYCIFLDSDDSLSNNAISTLYRAIESTSSDIIIFNGSYIINGKREPLWPNYKEQLCIFNEEDIIQFHEDVIKTNRFNNIWLKAIKRSLILRSDNSKSASFVRLEEDLMMQLPFFDSAKSFAYIPADIYEYRYNPNSVTHSFHSSMYEWICYVYEQRMAYGKKWRVHNYEFECNKRLMQGVISSLKQANLQKGRWSPHERKKYITNIVNSEKFKKIYMTGKFDITKRQKLFLFAAYYKIWPVLNIMLYFDGGKNGKS